MRKWTGIRDELPPDNTVVYVRSGFRTFKAIYSYRNKKWRSLQINDEAIGSILYRIEYWAHLPEKKL